MNGPRFLEILVDTAKQLSVPSTLEVAQIEEALEPDTPDVGERFPVGRHLWGNGSALDAHGAPLLPRRQVSPNDGVDRPVRILVVFECLARRDVLAVIK